MPGTELTEQEQREKLRAAVSTNDIIEITHLFKKYPSLTSHDLLPVDKVSTSVSPAVGAIAIGAVGAGATAFSASGSSAATFGAGVTGAVGTGIWALGPIALVGIGIGAVSYYLLSSNGSGDPPPSLPTQHSATEKKNSYDVLLSHDWGVEGQNHKKISVLNEKLQSPGKEKDQRPLTTWFDEDKLSGFIPYKICRGIEQSKVTLCCITKNYRDKVNQENGNGDYCHLEFHYSWRQRKPMIGVVIDKEMKPKNEKEWSGPFAGYLGTTLSYDLSDITNWSEVDKNLEYQRLRAAIHTQISKSLNIKNK